MLSSNRKRVKHNNEFYWIAPTGEVMKWYDDHDLAIDRLFEEGNYFHTEEEALAWLKSRKP